MAPAMVVLFKHIYSTRCPSLAGTTPPRKIQMTSQAGSQRGVTPKRRTLCWLALASTVVSVKPTMASLLLERDSPLYYA